MYVCPDLFSESPLCLLLLMWIQLWAARTTNHYRIPVETGNFKVFGVLFWAWLKVLLPFVCVISFSILHPVSLIKVNCLIWSPPGRRGPSPRAKPLCHTSYGKFLRGRAAPQPPHDHRRALQTASPLLLGVATLWAWLQAGVVLTPPVSWLMKWERFKIRNEKVMQECWLGGIFFWSGSSTVVTRDTFDTHTHLTADVWLW